MTGCVGANGGNYSGSIISGGGALPGQPGCISGFVGADTTAGTLVVFIGGSSVATSERGTILRWVSGSGTTNVQWMYSSWLNGACVNGSLLNTNISRGGLSPAVVGVLAGTVLNGTAILGGSLQISAWDNGMGATGEVTWVDDDCNPVFWQVFIVNEPLDRPRYEGFLFVNGKPEAPAESAFNVPESCFVGAPPLPSVGSAGANGGGGAAAIGGGVGGCIALLAICGITRVGLRRSAGGTGSSGGGGGGEGGGGGKSVSSDRAQRAARLGGPSLEAVGQAYNAVAIV